MNKFTFIMIAVLVLFITACNNNNENSTSDMYTKKQDTETTIADSQTTTDEKDNSEEKTTDDNQEDKDDNQEDKKEEKIESPVKEEIEGGTKFIFNKLPKSEQDIKQMVDFKDEKYITALFLASLVRFVENADDGIKMINVLRGPQAMSDYDINFLKNQLSDKKYLPQSYFEGATPENNYKPKEPFTVNIFDEDKQIEEGYIRTFVWTKGADNIRYMTLRQKGDEWFVWEYPGIVSGIKIPADADVWK